MKHLTKLLLILPLALVLLLSGCSAKPKTFAKDGFSITLSNQFSEFEEESCLAAYQSKKSVVLIAKESFEDLKDLELDSSNSPAAYAELIISANELGEIDVIEENGRTYFNYQQTVHRTQYSYIAFVVKDSTGFWLVQFASATRNYNDLQESFFAYFDSFTLTES